MKLRFDIEGPTGGTLAEAVSAFARDQFDATPNAVEAGAGGTSRDAATLATLGLLLAIPGSALAAMQIAEKLELKRRLERLLGRVREEDEEQARILLTINGRTTLDLRTTSAERIIVVLETEAKKDPR